MVLLAKGDRHHDLPSHLRPHGVENKDMWELRMLGKEAMGKRLCA